MVTHVAGLRRGVTLDRKGRNCENTGMSMEDRESSGLKVLNVDAIRTLNRKYNNQERNEKESLGACLKLEKVYLSKWLEVGSSQVCEAGGRVNEGTG